MMYKKTKENILIVRLDPGEDIYQSILKLSEQENIALATVQGIGAVNDITLGLFDPVTKEYTKKDWKNENFEIVSLLGNITTLDNKPYLHLHMSVADKDGHVYGGHLNKAIISATGEIIVTILDGRVDRYFDEKIGLNLFNI